MVFFKMHLNLIDMLDHGGGAKCIATFKAVFLFVFPMSYDLPIGSTSESNYDEETILSELGGQM